MLRYAISSVAEMQAFDLEIGQQFCCVDAASQSTENSSPISAAEKWAPLGRRFPAVVILLTQLWCSLWLHVLCPRLLPGSQWGIMQSSKPSEHFGGPRGWTGRGESGRAALSGDSCHRERRWLWKQTGCVRNAGDVFQGDKTLCYAEGWNCLEKETQGCLSCIELFLAISCFQNG